MSGKIIIRYMKIISFLIIFGILFFYQGQGTPGGCPSGGSGSPGCPTPPNGPGPNGPATSTCSYTEQAKCDGDQACVWDNGSCKSASAYCQGITDPSKCSGKCTVLANGTCGPIAQPHCSGTSKDSCGNDCIWNTSKITDPVTLAENTCVPCSTFNASGSSDPKKGDKQKYCEQAKNKNNDAVCKWENDKCVPTQQSNILCGYGGIRQVDLANPTETKCPQGAECCHQCVTTASGSIPADKSKGYGFGKVGSAIRVYCCTGLYYTDSKDIPAKDSKIEDKLISDVYSIVDPVSGKTPTTDEELSKACKALWNGFNAEVQTQTTESGGSVEINYIDRSRHTDRIPLCISVKRSSSSGNINGQTSWTTKHIFLCKNEHYLNTFSIRLKATKAEQIDAGKLSKGEIQAEKLPFLYWDSKASGDNKRKVDAFGNSSSYLGPADLIQILDEVEKLNPCESCKLAVDEQNYSLKNSPSSIIEKIYNFYYELLKNDGGANVLEMLSKTTNSEKKDALSEFLAEGSKRLEVFKYFFNADREGVAKALRVKSKESCKRTAANASELDHFVCCWMNGKKTDDTPESNCSYCDGCYDNLKKILYTTIKEKLESLCKNIFVPDSAKKCRGKSESDCKGLLYCRYDTSKKECVPEELPKNKDIIPIVKIQINGKEENLEIPSDFFSSQKCVKD
jgi:hypothetical protein